MENKETKTDIKLNVYQRLAKVRQVATFIQKKRVIDPTGKDKLGYAVVTSSNVLNAVNEAINENGLFLSVSMSSQETISYNFINQWGKDCVGYKTKVALIYKWVNIDNPVDCVDNIFWECEAVNNAGDPAKSMGASLTYAEKYFMLKYFNIATDEHDPDLDKKDGGKILSKVEKEKLEAEKIALEKALDEKKALEKAKVWNEFYEKMKETLSNKSFKSVSEYVEFIEITYLKKSPQLKENQGFKSIFEAFMPKAQVLVNKASQSLNIDKCNECKNTQEYCVCDIDSKVLANV